MKALSYKLITGIVILCLGIAFFLYWQYRSFYPSTDNAYLQANIVHIAAEVTGPIQALYITNNQPVHKNELLFSIDPAPYAVALNKAAAALVLARQQVEGSSSGVNAAMALVAERQASLAAATKNAGRILNLVDRHQLSEAEGDTAKTNLNVAKASLEAAQQQLKEAEQNLGQRGEHNPQVLAAKAAYDAASLDLQHTQVVAPADGYIADFSLRPGTMVNRGQSLFAVIEKNEWWLDANFKETDLERIRSGQPADFELDMYPDHTFHGVVDSVSRGSGATFSLLPPENATGNWVKVTQRFTTRIRVKNPPQQYPLRVGASATVTIDTVHHG